MDPRKIFAKRKRVRAKIPTPSLEIILAIIKAALWAIVAAGLFIAWFIMYFKPILQKENELSRIENEILRFKAEKQSQANEVTRDSLMQMQDSLMQSLAIAESLRSAYEFDLASLRETYRLRLADADSHLQLLSQRYEQLSTDLSLTDAQRLKYKQLADSMSVERDSLQSALKRKKKPGGPWGGQPWGGGAWGQ